MISRTVAASLLVSTVTVCFSKEISILVISGSWERERERERVNFQQEREWRMQYIRPTFERTLFTAEEQPPQFILTLKTSEFVLKENIKI